MAPSEGLTKVLSRRSKGTDDLLSRTSTAGDTMNSPESGGKRASIDRALGKLKDSLRSEDNDYPLRRTSLDSSHSSGKFSKLISKTKRWKSKDAEDLLRHDAANRPSAMERQVSADQKQDADVDQSEVSLELDHSGGSSLLTEDSDDEIQPTRPSIVPRQSHAGYLTLSSPLLASAQVDPIAPKGSGSVSPNIQTAVQSLDNLAPKHASTLKAPTLRKRSSSPANKIKAAFKRRSTDPKGLISDSASEKSASSDGRLNSSHGLSRETTVSDEEDDDNSTLDLPSLSEDPTEERPEHLATPRLGSSPGLLEHAPPSTPPQKAEAPSTLVTPPTPTSLTAAKNSQEQNESPPSNTTVTNPNIIVSASGNQISHRRSRSSTNNSTKLAKSPSNLPPTAEETKTPGGSLTHPNTTGGFFSSMFSAAQSAANQLGNSINTSSASQTQKAKNVLGLVGSEKAVVANGEASDGIAEAENGTVDDASDKRQLAVETLGTGSLSLSHLGIDDSENPSPMSSVADLPEKPRAAATIRRDEAAANIEDQQAARAVSAAYEKPPVAEDDSIISEPGPSRPLSLSKIDSTATPPRTAPMEPDGVGILRSGSVRSKISGRRRKRHRGSSATTSQSNIAAGLMGVGTALANPTVAMNGRMPTGFAVASSKRNREFHQLFRSVPEDDYLIEDYSAALQRDILLQGRLYVSEGHVCFSSNILGWVTNLVISFDEVVSVEKKNTAVIFPNAIVIQTLHARNVFASFVTRDSTYDLLIGIWKISHPNLKSSVNGVTLDDSGTGDKTEKAESIATEEASLEASDDEVYDEDAEDDEGGSSINDQVNEANIENSELGEAVRTISRKTSAPAVAATAAAPGSAPVSNRQSEGMDPATTGAAVSADYPGTPTHEPTSCGDTDTHYDKVLIDTTVPAPLGKIYSLMFGPGSEVFMKKWLVDDQRNWDLSWENYPPGGMTLENKAFGYTYMKPLNAPIGPKQTKCIMNQTMLAMDLEKAVSVDCSTQNPDVPSGNAFVTKTRYCLMWGPENSTRVVMNFTIEWTGKSWLKAPIEKGAVEGQTQYAKDIVAALRAAVVTKPPVRGPRPGGKAGGRGKKGKKDVVDTDAIPEPGAQAAQAIVQKKAQSWGPLEPVRAVLEPVGQILGQILGPLASPQVGCALLVLMIGWWWLRSGTMGGNRGAGPPGVGRLGPAERAVAYEEIWRKEESELWDWLEERVGLEGVPVAGVNGAVGNGKGSSGRGMKKVLQSEKMNERQMDDAIRVTEMKLNELKEAMGRKRGAEGTASERMEKTD